MYNPRNSEVYGLLGYSYLRNEQINRAIESLQISLRRNPKNLMSHYNLALAYWANGQKTDAIEELRTLYQLDSKYEGVVKKDAQFRKILNSKEYETINSPINN